VVKDAKEDLSKKVLNDVFKEWFQMNYGNRKPPKLAELVEAMTKKYGKVNAKGRWSGVKIKDDDDNDKNDLDELN
jgi:hypothetical protein